MTDKYYEDILGIVCIIDYENVPDGCDLVSKCTLLTPDPAHYIKNIPLNNIEINGKNIDNIDYNFDDSEQSSLGIQFNGLLLCKISEIFSSYILPKKELHCKPLEETEKDLFGKPTGVF